MMQLLVLGPAFGLPSIDAECIAAIGLLRLTFGGDTSKWTLSACRSDTGSLPTLLDGDQRLNGFDTISRHIAEHKSVASTNDGEDVQCTNANANAIAISALLQSRAPPLISAYLYVSAENYHNVTREAFSQILSPFSRFLLPTALRAAAQDNAAQLGISTAAVDTKHDDRRLAGVDSSFEAESRQKASLILPAKASIQDLLAKKTEGAALFKLHALADALFGPLQDMLGEKDWLLEGNKPGTVDCFAYGYLSLMAESPMPSNWLSIRLNERYKPLAAYTARMRNVLGLQTQLSDLADDVYRSPYHAGTTPTSTKLPWKPLDPKIAPSSNHLVNTLEYLSPSLQRPAIVTKRDLQDRDLTSYSASGAIAGLALTAMCGGAWLLRDLWHMKHGQHTQVFGQKPVADFGHVSQALAGLNILYQPLRNQNTSELAPPGPDHPLAETSVEL